jgi:hypothetical protein
MTDHRSRLNIGIPVEWMVDQGNPEKALGVVYEFSLTGERKTVWYTPDGKPTLNAIIIRENPNGSSGK